MKYIHAKEAAEKWGVSVHRVQEFCKHGRIEGASRFGNNWMIPSDAPRPLDGRRREARAEAEKALPLPRRAPLLAMTDLYDRSGCAEKVAMSLSSIPEAKEMFESEIAYYRGEIDHVYGDARYFLKNHTGFYAVLGSGILLAFCAIWRGDLQLWQKAKQHIIEAPCKNESDREIVLLALAIIDSAVYETGSYPVWFTRGNFQTLLPDSHPSAKVFYGRFLYASAFGVASRQVELEGVKGLALMRMIPNTLEPLISQAILDRTVIAELQLRLLCATAYHNAGEDTLAIEHIDRAIQLALPDQLYGVLAEASRTLDYLLRERLNLVDPEATKLVNDLYKRYTGGLSTLRSMLQNRYKATNLTTREREVAKLIAFGFTTRQIAEKLLVTESAIKQTVTKLMQKTGLDNRNEFVYIL